MADAEVLCHLVCLPFGRLVGAVRLYFLPLQLHAIFWLKCPSCRPTVRKFVCPVRHGLSTHRHPLAPEWTPPVIVRFFVPTLLGFDFAGGEVVYVAPDPAFPGFDRADQRVFGGVEVFGGVLVF